MKSVLDRIVRLRRLARSTPSEEERDTAEREVARLAARHNISEAVIEVAIEEGDGPYSIDAGAYGHATASIAAFLVEMFADDVGREGARVVARSDRRQRAHDAAQRYRHLSGLADSYLWRRGYSTKEAPQYFMALAAALADRLASIPPPRGCASLKKSPAVANTSPAGPGVTVEAEVTLRPGRKGSIPVADVSVPASEETPSKKKKPLRRVSAVVKREPDPPACAIPEYLLLAGLEDAERVDLRPLYVPTLAVPRKRLAGRAEGPKLPATHAGVGRKLRNKRKREREEGST